MKGDRTGQGTSPASIGKTPVAGIEDEIQLASYRQRGVIVPRSTVERDAPRRLDCQRPRRRHARSVPATAVRLRRAQPRLRRRSRTPGAEADADRIPILDDGQHRRPPSGDLARHPPSKVMIEQPLIFNGYDTDRLRNRFGECERRPSGLPDSGPVPAPWRDLTTGERHVPIRIAWRISKIDDGQFFLRQTIKFVGNLGRNIRSNSPCQSRRTADNRKEWPTACSRFTRRQNASLVVEDEPCLQIEIRCTHVVRSPNIKTPGKAVVLSSLAFLAKGGFLTARRPSLAGDASSPADRPELPAASRRGCHLGRTVWRSALQSGRR